MKMEMIDINSAKLAYKIFGRGKIDVVIETALNSCSAEWWHLAEKLANKHTVLVYERAGYGLSFESNLKRSPKNISDELFQILEELNSTEKIILIGHSQGGLYVQQFARLYPQFVKGLVLIDPLSANDNNFKALLSPEEYKKSGVDKLQSLKIAFILTKLKLGFFFIPLLKKAPPFYYYHDFSKDATKYILNSLTASKQYKTAIEEYIVSHQEEEIKDLKVKGDFPDIPLTLITHSSKIEVDEIIYYGGATKEEAEIVEMIWQNLMKEYLGFSSKSKYIQAQRSSHYIHLTEFEIIESALDEMLS